MLKLIAKITGLLTPSERKRAVIMIALMFCGMLLETLGIGLIIPIMGLFMQGDLAASYPQVQPILDWLGNPSQLELIVLTLLLLVAVFLLKALFLGVSLWWQMRFVFGVQASLSGRIFNSYLRQPYSFHLNKNTAQLLRNAVTEVTEFNSRVLVPGTQLVGESLVVVGIVVLLLTIEPIGALVTFGIVLTMSWIFYRVIREPLTRWGAARQHHEGLRIQHIQQGLGAIKDIKLLGREQEFFNQFDTHNQLTASMSQKRATVVELPRLWLEVLAVGGLATLVAVMVKQGKGVEEIMPFLGLFGAAVFRLLPSANRILSSVQSLRFGLPVVDTLYEELHAVEDGVVTSQEGPAAKRSSERSLSFDEQIAIKGLSFYYPESVSAALRNLSIKIDRGESVGLIGESGSGKSTVVDLILGLLSPSNGVVTVDGVDIRGDLRAWQRNVGYVPQSIYLSDDTLRRNIAFGVSADQIDDAAVERAARAAQLESFIDRLPEGLETFVGERGVRLSGGQRQRIGIARALYFDPEVLVLDEATSALDSSTEESVMQAVENLHGKKTLIIVAHRISTLKGCDRVYRFDKGELVQKCTFDELSVS